MTSTWFKTAAAVALAALLAGCGSSVKLDETPVETRTPTPAEVTQSQAGASSAAGSAAGARPQSQVATVDLNRAPGSGTSGASAKSGASLPRVIYFDFDSFVIKDEFRPLIDAYAKALSGDKSRHMVIEGHTDERGGSEYNLALGQKRAEAVAKSLELLGVSERQLEAVSYGKERPVAEGHDEDSWAKNRRAELKDK